jgi:TIR domain
VAFTYDAFVSYSRRDAAWATRVSAALRDKGLRIFLDTERLLAGEIWTTQLLDAIEGSQHLVVLWSEQAKSDWVTDEIASFRAQLRHPSSEGDNVPRHIIPIYLEGEYQVLAQYEHIDEIREAGMYDAGPDAVPAEVWRTVVDQLEASIRAGEATRRVPVLVVTTTREALRTVEPGRQLPPAPLRGMSLDALIENLGLASRDALLASYGPDRSDWRPFGSATSVKAILEQLKDDINNELSAAGLQRFRWEYLDDEFWTDTPERVAERLKREPNVIVLDLLSLYDDYVRWMTTNHVIPSIRENDSAVLMVLPPFAMPPTATALRESIRGLATEVFNSFYNPPVFSRGRYARYVTSVGDEVDLKAWLLTGIGPVLADEVRDNRVVYTET